MKLDAIVLEVLWKRLIALTDEAAGMLVRSSFCTIVRESNDYACVLMDAGGRSVAQSSVSVPSFIGTLPITCKHFLRRFPPETLRPGDVLLTNDPWLATGHLPDMTMITPIFWHNRLIAFAGCTAHSPDVGGRIRSGDAREVFEEGLRLPPLKFVDAGCVNEVVVDVIRTNVRVPDQVMGDLMAQVATNEMAGRRLIELLQEYPDLDFSGLAQIIQHKSEEAIRTKIRALPRGEYVDVFEVDGFDSALTIRCAITIDGETLRADYTGSSAQVPQSINSVLNYTYAYTAYPIKCVLDPHVPNNEGCFNPIQVWAPEGTFLNPKQGAGVGGRALTGHHLHAAVFGALANILPERVQADSGAPLWMNTPTGINRAGERFAGTIFWNGGVGASASHNGLSATAYPGNISNTPVEMIEHQFPLLFQEKSLVTGTGGAGRFRGGDGQRVVYQMTNHEPITVSFLLDRLDHPARGRLGGHSGSPGIALVNGRRLEQPKRVVVLQPGDVVTLQTPGGGGCGEPNDRPSTEIKAGIES
jgi:N-methylhydantoinase B